LLFAGLLFAAFCFIRGATAPVEQTRLIEDVQPGHRVLVDAPEEALAIDVARLTNRNVSWNIDDGSLEIEGIVDPLRMLLSANPTQIKQAEYRLILIQANEVWEDGTNNEINVATLQPWQWIDEHEVRVGGDAPLPLETIEMNLPAGMTGKVLDILPCPEIEPGRGRVVLTTVNRLASSVIELTLRDLAGLEESLRPTSEHLFYSVTRGEWLPAGDLQPGEHLDGTDGPITVASVTRLAGTHRVYNMTVQGEHLYRVAEFGVLVHNNYSLRRNDSMLKRKTEEVFPDRGDIYDLPHHLIPMSMVDEFQGVFKRARSAGWKQNGAVNGRLLSEFEHRGGHLNYNSYVKQEIQAFVENHKSGYKGKEAREFLEKLADDMRSYLEANPGVNINNLPYHFTFSTQRRAWTDFHAVRWLRHGPSDPAIAARCCV